MRLATWATPKPAPHSGWARVGRARDTSDQAAPSLHPDHPVTPDSKHWVRNAAEIRYFRFASLAVSNAMLSQRSLVAALQQIGGGVTLEDLDSYKPWVREWRAPRSCNCLSRRDIGGR